MPAPRGSRRTRGRAARPARSRTSPCPRPRSRSRSARRCPGSTPTASSRTARAATTPGRGRACAGSSPPQYASTSSRVVGHVEAGLAGDVAELEAGLVHARVLVVDEPDPVAVVDEVGGEQVVVARHQRLVARPHRVLERLDQRRELVVVRRQPEPVVDARCRGTGAGSPACRSRRRTPARRAGPVRLRRPAGASAGRAGPRPSSVRPGRNPTTSTLSSGSASTTGRADTGLGGAPGVEPLVDPVDGQQPGLVGRDPHDVVAGAAVVGERHPVVARWSGRRRAR